MSKRSIRPLLALNLRSRVEIAKNSGGWKTTRACTEIDFLILKAQTTKKTTRNIEESKLHTQKENRKKLNHKLI